MRPSKSTRFAALLTLFFFLSRDISFADSLYPRVEGIPSAEVFSIPEELGTVSKIEARSSHESQPDLIIHIQDAHTSLDAQRNTGKILEYLQTQYGMDLIFVEGAIGKLNPHLLNYTADQQINEKVAQLLLERGILGGAELFLFEQIQKKERNTPAQAYGVEDFDLYRKNLDSFREVYSHKGDSDLFLEKIKLAVEKAASKKASKKLKVFLKEWLFYQDHPEEIARYMKLLSQNAQSELRISFESALLKNEYPQISHFFAIERLEKKQSKSARDKEFQKLLLWGKSVSLEPALIEGLKDSAITGLRTKNLREVLESFYKKASPKGFDFTTYPHLSVQWGSSLLREEIQTDQLLLEIERLTDAIFHKLAVTETEKRLVALHEDYLLLKKCFSLELSRPEYQDMLKKQKNLTPFAVVQRVMVLGESPANIPSLSKINDAYTRVLRFYSLAVKREAMMFNNTIRGMDENYKTKAVLITGGFHTEGLQDYLKRANMSVIEITPRISGQSSNKNYLRLMMDRDTSKERHHLKSPLWLTDPLLAQNLVALGERNPALAAVSDALRTAGANPAQMISTSEPSSRSEVRSSTGDEDNSAEEKMVEGWLATLHAAKDQNGISLFNALFVEKDQNNMGKTIIGNIFPLGYQNKGTGAWAERRLNLITRFSDPVSIAAADDLVAYLFNLDTQHGGNTVTRSASTRAMLSWKPSSADGGEAKQPRPNDRSTEQPITDGGAAEQPITDGGAAEQLAQFQNLADTLVNVRNEVGESLLALLQEKGRLSGVFQKGKAYSVLLYENLLNITLAANKFDKYQQQVEELLDFLVAVEKDRGVPARDELVNNFMRLLPASMSKDKLTAWIARNLMGKGFFDETSFSPHWTERAKTPVTNVPLVPPSQAERLFKNLLKDQSLQSSAILIARDLVLDHEGGAIDWTQPSPLQSIALKKFLYFMTLYQEVQRMVDGTGEAPISTVAREALLMVDRIVLNDELGSDQFLALPITFLVFLRDVLIASGLRMTLSPGAEIPLEDDAEAVAFSISNDNGLYFTESNQREPALIRTTPNSLDQTTVFTPNLPGHVYDKDNSDISLYWRIILQIPHTPWILLGAEDEDEEQQRGGFAFNIKNNKTMPFAETLPSGIHNAAVHPFKPEVLLLFNHRTGKSQYSLTFSSEGLKINSRAASGRIAHQSIAREMHFSPDGRWLASLSSDGQELKIFSVNAEGKNLKYEQHSVTNLNNSFGQVLSFTFSPDGGHILVGTYRETEPVNQNQATDGGHALMYNPYYEGVLLPFNDGALGRPPIRNFPNERGPFTYFSSGHSFVTSDGRIVDLRTGQLIEDLRLVMHDNPSVRERFSLSQNDRHVAFIGNQPRVPGHRRPLAARYSSFLSIAELVWHLPDPWRPTGGASSRSEVRSSTEDEDNSAGEKMVESWLATLHAAKDQNGISLFNALFVEKDQNNMGKTIIGHIFPSGYQNKGMGAWAEQKSNLITRFSGPISIAAADALMNYLFNLDTQHGGNTVTRSASTRAMLSWKPSSTDDAKEEAKPVASEGPADEKGAEMPESEEDVAKRLSARFDELTWPLRAATNENGQSLLEFLQGPSGVSMVFPKGETSQTSDLRREFARLTGAGDGSILAENGFADRSSNVQDFFYFLIRVEKERGGISARDEFLQKFAELKPSNGEMPPDELTVWIDNNLMGKGFFNEEDPAFVPWSTRANTPVTNVPLFSPEWANRLFDVSPERLSLYPDPFKVIHDWFLEHEVYTGNVALPPPLQSIAFKKWLYLMMLYQEVQRMVDGANPAPINKVGREALSWVSKIVYTGEHTPDHSLDRPINFLVFLRDVLIASGLRMNLSITKTIQMKGGGETLAFSPDQRFLFFVRDAKLIQSTLALDQRTVLPVNLPSQKNNDEDDDGTTPLTWSRMLQIPNTHWILLGAEDTDTGPHSGGIAFNTKSGKARNFAQKLPSGIHDAAVHPVKPEVLLCFNHRTGKSMYSLTFSPDIKSNSRRGYDEIASQSTAREMHFSPDGRWLASLSSNGQELKIFSVDAEGANLKYKQHSVANLNNSFGQVLSFTFSPDGGHILMDTYREVAPVNPNQATDGRHTFMDAYRGGILLSFNDGVLGSTPIRRFPNEIGPYTYFSSGNSFVTYHGDIVDAHTSQRIGDLEINTPQEQENFFLSPNGQHVAFIGTRRRDNSTPSLGNHFLSITKLVWHLPHPWSPTEEASSRSEVRREKIPVSASPNPNSAGNRANWLLEALLVAAGEMPPPEATSSRPPQVNFQAALNEFSNTMNTLQKSGKWAPATGSLVFDADLFVNDPEFTRLLVLFQAKWGGDQTLIVSGQNAEKVQNIITEFLGKNSQGYTLLSAEERSRVESGILFETDLAQASRTSARSKSPALVYQTAKPDANLLGAPGWLAFIQPKDQNLPPLERAKAQFFINQILLLSAEKILSSSLSPTEKLLILAQELEKEIPGMVQISKDGRSAQISPAKALDVFIRQYQKISSSA